jgi:hypothetical protein
MTPMEQSEWRESYRNGIGEFLESEGFEKSQIDSIESFITSLLASEKKALLEEIKREITGWTRDTCGHTNKQHLDPEVDCPAWSIEDDRARGVVLDQILHSLSLIESKTKEV